MQLISVLKIDSTKSLLNWAIGLSIFTIGYNVIEGVVSVYFGYQDDTLALFGFGLDSFVEVISALGITHMIFRMRDNESVDEVDRFEMTALRVTGTAFYILTIGLLTGAVYSIYHGIHPQTTIVGIIVSIISILVMYGLYRIKVEVGEKLGSAPIISDANCTLSCFYLSFILLASSIIYEYGGLGYIDALGSVGIAFFAFKEGREAFGKAHKRKLACGCNDGSCSND